MSDKTCPCHICGLQCKDWNDAQGTNKYTIVCRSCANQITLSVDKDHYDYVNGNGWEIRPNETSQRLLEISAAIVKLKSQIGNSITIVAQEFKWPEAACKVCNRKNDSGNPEVIHCWNCGNKV